MMHLKQVRVAMLSQPFYSAFFLFAASCWISIIASGAKFYADEKYHYKQISWFFKGKFEIMDILTTIPGYHALIASLVSWMDDLSFFRVRIVSFTISLLIIPVFYLLAKRLEIQDPVRKTLLLLSLPIAFIYYPLIYTDMLSAGLVLAGLFATLSKRYSAAAVFSTLSIAVRQNNIVWHIFLWILGYFETYGFSFSLKKIMRYMVSTPAFFLGTIAFAVFVFLNHGIAIGDKQSHQAGFYLGNIYFFLMLSSIIFLPDLLEKILSLKRYIAKKSFWIAVAAAVSIAAAISLLPPQLHGYNGDARFARNIVLLFFYHGHLWLYSVLAFFGFLSLCSVRFQKPSFYLAYPFIALYLLPSWLIEQRYAIIPFLLILLFQKEASRRMDILRIIYFLMLSLALVLMIIHTKLFL